MSEEYARQMEEDEALAQRVLHRPDAKRRVKGPQFDPEAGSPTDSSFYRQLFDKMGILAPEEQLYPDFIKVRRQLELDPMLAQKGEADVEPLRLARGDSNLTSFWPGGGRYEGPSRVAAGSNILGGQPWQYYDVGNPNAPWIGMEGPRGTLGQWRDIPGETRRGRVIDVKQQGYGGYGILRRGQYDRRGNLIPGSGGGGGGGRTISGGPFEGWTPGQMDQWHGGAGPSQLGYPSFTGNTAGPGGQNLAFETTSYNVPGMGWVPRAQLANAQASNNPLDYLNPFGGTSKGGSNTGGPSERVAGTTVGTLSNMVLPGSGFITGPVARWGYHTLFSPGGLFNRKGQQGQVVAQKQQAQKVAPAQPAPVAPTQTPQGGGYAASSRSPTGQAIDPRSREWWSPDFGRNDLGSSGQGAGGYNLAGPGGGFGQRGTGFGSGTVGNMSTALGFESLGRGGGQANFGSAWGGGPAAQQMRHIYKGIYGNDPNPEGMGALYGLTGTRAPGMGQYQQSQQQFRNLLQTNPSLMSGYSSGPMRRGGSRIPLLGT